MWRPDTLRSGQRSITTFTTSTRRTHTGQSIRMPFSLKRGVKRHECGAIVGNDVVFISVQQNGNVDFSELRVRAQAETNKNRQRTTPQVWMKHIDKTFGFEDVDLLELLRWSVTSAFRPQPRMRKTFCLQLLWNIGRAVENTLLVNLNAEGASESNELVLKCDSSPSARHRYVWPLLGCQEANRMAPHSDALRSADLLVEKADLTFAQLDHLDHPLLQHRKTRAIRRISSLKKTMKYKSTDEAPFLMHIPEGKNTSERPPTKSRQAESLPKRSSAQEVTGRPAKKLARSRS